MPTPLRDLGELVAGEAVEVEFPYLNAGTAPLRISRIKTTCRCVASDTIPPLAPGESGALRLRVATSAWWDRELVEGAEILSNDPAHPVVKLQIKATVRPLFEVAPANPLRLAVKRGEAVPQVFTLTPAAAAPVQVTGVEPGGPGVEARLLLGAEGGGSGQTRVEVVAHPKGDEDEFARFVIVNTTHPRVPQFRLILHAVAGERIIVSPPYLHLGALDAGAREGKLHIAAVYRRRSPLRVRAATADTRALEVAVRSAGESRTEIVVRYRGGWTAGPKAGLLTITTDDADAPQLQLGYQAMVVGERRAKGAVPQRRLAGKGAH